MALNKVTVDIPLTGGVNTKVAAKSVKPPEFITLSNTRFTKSGSIDKAYGYNNLGLEVSGSAVNSPVGLATIRDELVMLTSDTLYTRSVKDSTWYDKGDLTATSTEISRIAASPVNSSNVDVLSQDDVTLAIWYEGTTYYYSVFDRVSGAVILERQTLVSAAGSIYPRLAKADGNLYAFWNTSTNIEYLRIATTDPSTVMTGNVVTDSDSAGYFDVAGYGTNLFILYKKTGSSSMEFSRLNQALTITADTNITEVPTASKTMCVYPYYSESLAAPIVFLGWVDGSNNIRTTAYNNGLGLVFAPATVETLASVDKLSIAVDSTTGSQVRYLYSVSNATTSKYYLKGNTVTTAGAVGTAAVIMRSVGLISKPLVYNDVAYSVVLHDSTLQASYFVITNDGRVVAKYLPGEGGTHATQYRTGNTSSIGDYDFVFGLLKKGRIQSENAVLFADRSPVLANLSFDPTKAFVTSTMHDNLLISGGIVSSYDGTSTTEYGFHLYPESVTAAEYSHGGTVPNGTYLVYAVYEWIDKRGVRYQSAPSIGTSITTTGSNNEIRVTVPALRVTDKSNYTTLTDRANVVVRVFVTENGGTVPYYAAQEDNPNILSTDAIEIHIHDDPATLTSNEILYTSSGELENIAPPSCKYLFTHDNRPVLVGLENENQISVGKDIKPGKGVGFNEDLVITLDPIGGGLVAGASMDTHMILFAETAIFAISGRGPNDLGQGDEYTPPTLISSDIGCSSPKGILQTPQGVVFKSKKGIYLLDRSLKLSYIGDKVSDYNEFDVISADQLKDADELRFMLDNGKTLVYNYYFGTWCVNDTPLALDATIWQDTYVYLTSLKVLQESTDTYLNDGSYVPTTIRTGWISMAGFQGSQRIYKMAMIGTYHTNHRFTITHFYDYSDIPQDQTVVSASTLVNTGVYGDSATWGSDSYWGGSANDEVYQLRESMPRQRCQSVSFQFRDTALGNNVGHGFSLEGVALLLGTKKGLHRVSTTRSI